MKTDFNQNDAITRFKECHFGYSPADKGYNFIAENKDYYVYSKTKESLETFFKFERNSKIFRTGTPVFLLLFFGVSVWVAMDISVLNVIIIWILGLIGFAGISYIMHYADKYLSDILHNTINIKKSCELTNE